MLTTRWPGDRVAESGGRGEVITRDRSSALSRIGSDRDRIGERKTKVLFSHGDSPVSEGPLCRLLDVGAVAVSLSTSISPLRRHSSRKISILAKWVVAVPSQSMVAFPAFPSQSMKPLPSHPPNQSMNPPPGHPPREKPGREFSKSKSKSSPRERYRRPPSATVLVRQPSWCSILQVSSQTHPRY